MKHLVTLLVVLVLILVGKGMLDGQAEQMVETAKDMYQEKRYDEALKALDKLEYFPWKPPAGEEGEELRQKIRKKITERERIEADERRWEAQREAERQQYELERQQEERAREARERLEDLRNR